MSKEQSKDIVLEGISKKVVVSVFLLSLIIGIIFVITKPLFYLRGDTEYVIYARNILAGHGFSLDARAPYHPDVYRTPGYSLFLALIYSIFGINNLIVMLIQAFLNALTCVLVFFITKRYFSLKFSYLVSFLVAVYPFTAVFTHVLYSEILCIFLVTLGIFLFEKARKSRNVLFFMLSGLTMGYCLLVRPGTALMFIFMDIAYLLVKNFRLVWKYFLAFNLCVILIWLPWVVRNYAVTGKFIPLTIEAKEELFWASASVGKYFENRMKNPKFARQYQEITAKLETSGLTGLEKRMKEEDFYLEYAVRNIKDNPFLYLFASIKRIPRMWVSILVPDDTSGNYGFLILGGNQVTFHIIKYFKMACLVLAIYGMWTIRRKWRELIFIFLPVIYFSLTHMFLLAEARFTLPARPYLLIFTLVGLISLIKIIYPKLKFPLYRGDIDK